MKTKQDLIEIINEAIFIKENCPSLSEEINNIDLDKLLSEIDVTWERIDDIEKEELYQCILDYIDIYRDIFDISTDIYRNMKIEKILK